MFPIRDDKGGNSFPLLTYLIIAVNILIFVAEMTNGFPETVISTYGLIPANVNFSVPVSLIPFITSQFLHAGFLHILSNMWFLKIFGDNVEDRVGKIKYIFIYLVSGLAGGVLQYASSPSSAIPVIGASGAVAGVLGAYFVFFPRNTIETLVPFGFYISTIHIPAGIMLFYWLFTQFLSGIGSFTSADVGGVAFWAHVGGFVCGFILAKFTSSDAKVAVSEEF